MKNELEKKGQAKPTGRRYSNVAELLKGEGAPATSIKRVQALSGKTRVAQQLVQIRIREGLTQAELAKKIGCTQSRISKIEAGHDEDITLGIIRDYVKATNGRISISCGKPMNHVEAVKAHAFGIKRHLESLADIAQKHDELHSHIQGFFGEAFFNILDILSKCQEQMPTGRQDFEMSLNSIDEEDTSSSGSHLKTLAAIETTL
jgi:transcriptional regulator with XRE-family HTH domain